MKTLHLLLLGLLLTAFSAEADVFITPASPTSLDVILAEIKFGAGGCSTAITTAVVGNAIRTDLVLTSCTIGSGVFQNVDYANFGPLPAGTYTYDVYVRYGTEDPPIYQSHQTIRGHADPSNHE